MLVANKDRNISTDISLDMFLGIEAMELSVEFNSDSSYWEWVQKNRNRADIKPYYDGQGPTGVLKYVIEGSYKEACRRWSEEFPEQAVSLAWAHLAFLNRHVESDLYEAAGVYRFNDAVVSGCYKDNLPSGNDVLVYPGDTAIAIEQFFLCEYRKRSAEFSGLDPQLGELSFSGSPKKPAKSVDMYMNLNTGEVGAIRTIYYTNYWTWFRFGGFANKERVTRPLCRIFIQGRKGLWGS